jgi:3-oxoacyl-[acyl-carrier protein] reductase
MEQFGRVDVVVNNAGITDPVVLAEDESVDDFRRVLDVNLVGTFLVCRAAIPHLIARGAGRIVNIASVAGLHASPGQANYAAAKGGVIALTQTLAREIAAKGITVNAVAPGLISTELTTALPERRFGELVSQVPLNRAGEPQDVAPLVRFLCSDEAGYITGSVFVVDGGMTS